MTSPISKKYFEKFADGFKNVDKNWEGMTSNFADNATIKYSFAGFPVIEGDEPTCNAGFKKALKTFKLECTYSHGTETDCMYSYSAYFETINGEGAVYTCHAFLEFDEDGKVTKKVAYSNDSNQLALLVANVK